LPSAGMPSWSRCGRDRRREPPRAGETLANLPDLTHRRDASTKLAASGQFLPQPDRACGTGPQEGQCQGRQRGSGSIDMANYNLHDGGYAY
jgi:hypothetical protein